MVSNRTGTRFILQIGHVPGAASTTSGCMGQVIEIGGRSGCGAVCPRCAKLVAAAKGKRHKATEKVKGKRKKADGRRSEDHASEAGRREGIKSVPAGDLTSGLPRGSRS